MTHNPPGNNCCGVAVDVFMTMATRHRWEEVRDVWPDDYTPPKTEVMRVDDSWIGQRTRAHFNFEEAMEYRSTFENWRERKRFRASERSG
jgi:hypothetical protein